MVPAICSESTGAGQRQLAAEASVQLRREPQLVELRQRNRVEDEVDAAEAALAKLPARQDERFVEAHGKVVQAHGGAVGARGKPHLRNCLAGVDEEGLALVDGETGITLHVADRSLEAHVADGKLELATAEGHFKAVDGEVANVHQRRGAREPAAAVPCLPLRERDHELAVLVLAQVDRHVAQEDVVDDQAKPEHRQELVGHGDLVGPEHVVRGGRRVVAQHRVLEHDAAQDAPRNPLDRELEGCPRQVVVVDVAGDPFGQHLGRLVEECGQERGHQHGDSIRNFPSNPPAALLVADCLRHRV